MTPTSRISPIAPALPSRSRPHSARTSASTSPASSLASRVLTLPRIGTTARSGRSRSNCARRRSDAVPTRAPRGKPARVSAPRPTSTSRGSSRLSTPADRKSGRQHRLHVLQRMHGEIDAAVEQRLLDFLREKALAADLGKQARLHAVPGRADRHEFERAVGGKLGMGRAQPVAHKLRLIQRHRAAAGSDAKRPARHECSSEKEAPLYRAIRCPASPLKSRDPVPASPTEMVAEPAAASAGVYR